MNHDAERLGTPSNDAFPDWETCFLPLNIGTEEPTMPPNERPSQILWHQTPRRNLGLILAIRCAHFGAHIGDLRLEKELPFLSWLGMDRWQNFAGKVTMQWKIGKVTSKHGQIASFFISTLWGWLWIFHDLEAIVYDPWGYDPCLPTCGFRDSATFPGLDDGLPLTGNSLKI